MTEDFNDLDRVIGEFKKLPRLQVRVGALNAGGGRSDDFMEMIAMANEFGVHIRAKNHKYLTIPTKEAGRRKASEIPNLFFHYTKQNHYPTLAVQDGDGVKIMFYLKTEVRIPERSFLRTTFDQHFSHYTNNYVDRVEHNLEKMMDGDMTARELYNDLGRLMVKDVQRTIAKATPSNSPLTIARKGKDSPLQDTGALYRSIDWTVIDND